ncbi:MAG: LamG domain-containing protein [Candidatus Bathyarchaeota archaeon]|nr:LamG domain-containing protein [Candidatus Bathyarchaeota archaeon]
MVKNYKTYVYLISLIIALALSIYVLNLSLPGKNEDYLELGLLGKDGKASHYFVTNSSVVNSGTTVSWTLYVGNNFKVDKQALIKVKLQNSTMSLPNDFNHIPSPSASILELPVNLSAKKSISFPIVWGIGNIEKKNTTQILKSLTVNGIKYDVSVPSTDARYSLILELWVYNSVTNQYSFEWKSSDSGSASVYMWFRAFSPTYPSVPLSLYLPFINMSNSTVDASGNNNDAFTHGYLVWLNGNGGCYYFNGVNTYINRASLSKVSNSQLTVTYWGRQTGATQNEMHTIGLFGNQSLTVYIAPNTRNYYVRSTISGITSNSSIGALDENWHHFAVTYDGSKLLVYVDGVLKSDVTAPGIITKIDDSLFLGATGVGSIPSGNWYYGAIDEVRIYPSALSNSDIQGQFTSEKSNYIP